MFSNGTLYLERYFQLSLELSNDMDEFQSMMQSDEMKKAAEEDGVKFDTLQVLIQT